MVLVLTTNVSQVITPTVSLLPSKDIVTESALLIALARTNLNVSTMMMTLNCHLIGVTARPLTPRHFGLRRPKNVTLKGNVIKTRNTRIINRK